MKISRSIMPSYIIRVAYVILVPFVTMVDGQQYQPQCDIFASEKPIAPYVSASTWDLPTSANANWTEYGTIRVMSYSGYKEETSY